jgi:large subunit ribosomal protein L31e
MGTVDVDTDTRFNKVVWTKGIRDVQYYLCVQLSRQPNKDGDSPDKLYTLVTYISVTTLERNPQAMWMKTKYWVSSKVTKL